MDEADEVPRGSSLAYVLNVVKKSQFASQERLSGGGEI